MKPITLGMSITLVAVAALWAQKSQQRPAAPVAVAPVAVAIDKGAHWLASTQGPDGGWGQDGGATSYVRQDEHLESNGNDVANTAVAALALRRAGIQYQPNVERAILFILQRVEASPNDGLAITDMQGTQIQRKLGPFIDTFLTSRLLSEVEGTLADRALNARVRRALEKCVAKIQTNQKSDGSWNISGGWAPVIGTSMAARSLYDARQKGVKVEDKVMARADAYTVAAAAPPPAATKPVGSAKGGAGGGSLAISGRPESAGVALYQTAQALEQLSRTEADRSRNAPQIAELKSQLSDSRFVEGFGSIGGEEFFSYLNLSDGLKRAGGEDWNKWHSQITEKIMSLQNSDGTWAGHHCITGRVAVTSGAILNLTVDRAN